MQIHETIKLRRKELDLTQEQLANYLGVTPPAVHKWEKGTSYPDITLLPALARLLEVDLNTLFSFEKELSEVEITNILNEVLHVMQQESFSKGYEQLARKIKEFPTCAAFLYEAAVFLDGVLIFHAREEMENYEEKVENLYERAVLYGDEKIKASANSMLITKYLKRKEVEKAEKLWETLPENGIDKNVLKATICINQGEYQQAACILEKKLLKSVNDTNSTLITLLQCFQNLGQDSKAEFCAEKIKDFAGEFGLWDYVKYFADYQMAVYRKDREQTLIFLKKMLEAAKAPYDISNYPLYTEIFAEGKGQEQKKSGFMEHMANTLAESLKTEAGVDGRGFLQGDAELEELLNKYIEA